MAVSTPVIAAVIGAGATIATQPGKPKAPKPIEAPKLPETKSAAASLDQGQLAARSAGGTILSQPGASVGDNANGVRKTLLGA